MIEQNSENVKAESSPLEPVTLTKIIDGAILTLEYLGEYGIVEDDDSVPALLVEQTWQELKSVQRALPSAVNAHAALEARIAALEDALQEVDDLARDCTYYEFGERYEEGMASKVGALLQNGGAQ